MEHFTKEELDLYRNGGMSVLRRIGCSAHLKTCPHCQSLLRELDQDDQLLRDLRGSVELYRQFTAKKAPGTSPKTL